MSPGSGLGKRGEEGTVQTVKGCGGGLFTYIFVHTNGMKRGSARDIEIEGERGGEEQAAAPPFSRWGRRSMGSRGVSGIHPRYHTIGKIVRAGRVLRGPLGREELGGPSSSRQRSGDASPSVDSTSASWLSCWPTIAASLRQRMRTEGDENLGRAEGRERPAAAVVDSSSVVVAAAGVAVLVVVADASGAPYESNQRIRRDLLSVLASSPRGRGNPAPFDRGLKG